MYYTVQFCIGRYTAFVTRGHPLHVHVTDLRADAVAPARSRMSHEKADKRVFMYQWLQLKRRGQDASFTPQFMEWEEASTDEAEATVLPDLG